MQHQAILGSSKVVEHDSRAGRLTYKARIFPSLSPGLLWRVTAGGSPAGKWIQNSFKNIKSIELAQNYS